MLRKHRALIVPLAILALIFAGSFFVPIYGDICTDAKNSDAKDCASYHIGLVFLWKIAKFLDAWSALIPAAATVAIGGFTLTLWRATEKQAGLTREAVRLTDEQLR